MNDLLLARIDEGIIALAGISAGVIIILLAVLSISLGSVAKSRHREQTRREIAAYVAEGTVSPQDAATLLSAGPDKIRERVAEALAWGTISAKGAERLINASARADQKPLS